MKKIKTKFIALVVCFCCATLFISPTLLQAQGLTENVKTVSLELLEEKVISTLTTGYSDFYSVEDYSVRIDDKRDTENGIEILMFVSMNMKLKIQDIMELPYVKGMLNRANIEKSNLNVRSGETGIRMAVQSANEDIMTDQQMDAVSYRIGTWFTQLSQYVGAVSDNNFYLKVNAELKDGSVVSDSINILIEDIDGGYIPVESVFPETAQSMEKQGIATIDYCIENSENVSLQRSCDVRAGVSDCINYMLAYTSNPSSCYDHGTSCGTKQNRSKWNNSEYKYYDTLCHNDCADYVSQALATYFSQDDTWYATKNTTKRSTTWVNTGMLKNHMLNTRGIFIEYDDLYAPITAGSVVYTEASHVVMLTYADTVSLKYSGHTNDRHNAAFSKSMIYEAYNLW